jgi:hypothetical protein
MFFSGKKSEKWYTFGITQDALNYCFQYNEDTIEAATKTFEQNRDQIESVAKRFASETKVRDASPNYLTTQEVYKNLVGGLRG